MTTATVQPTRANVWWVFLLQGIAAILPGFMLLTAPAATLVSLVTFLGFYRIVSGVLSFVQMFVDRSVPWICLSNRDYGCRCRYLGCETSPGRRANRANRYRDRLRR
jgi:uncharacterized membrane protein HdeD (DUF308 family)